MGGKDNWVVFVKKQVEFGSGLQTQSVDLRDRILRKPLGLQFSKEDLEKEATDHHIVALYNEELIGVLLLRPVDTETIKMRQVAIDIEWQQKGIGTGLVDFAERFSKSRGYKRIEMHARLEAVPFYERLDYNTEGELFHEVGIPHYKMVKTLS